VSSVAGYAIPPTLVKNVEFYETSGDSAKICKYAIKHKPGSAVSCRHHFRCRALPLPPPPPTRSSIVSTDGDAEISAAQTAVTLYAMRLVSLIPPRIRRQRHNRAALLARGCLGFYGPPGLFVPALFTNDGSTKWSTWWSRLKAMHARPASPPRETKRSVQQLDYERRAHDIEISGCRWHRWFLLSSFVRL